MSKPSTIRRHCTECGREYETSTLLTPNLCTQCRRVKVAPTISLLSAMNPCCREAYMRGRLAAAVDNNNRDAIRELGHALDQLRALERTRT